MSATQVSNVARTGLPSVHVDCERAESDRSTDPAAACFPSDVEVIVDILRDVTAKAVPGGAA